MSEFNLRLPSLYHGDSSVPLATQDQALLAPRPNPDHAFWDQMKRDENARFERMAMDFGRVNVQGL